MRLSLFTLLLSLPGYFMAQDNQEVSFSKTKSSVSTKVVKFDNSARKFNDWAVSVGGGTAFLHNSDLTSFNEDGNHFGWNAYISLEKQISDKFALILEYQKGETTQTARLGYNTWGLPANAYGLATAKTQYDQVSLLGDLNFSNFFRRIDNKSPFRFAVHGYFGIGFQGYHYARKDQDPRPVQETYREFTQKLGIDSFIYQAGLGFKYNLSRRIDLEARIMYVVTGDDEFDGGGEDTGEWPGYNQRIKNTSDNLVTANIGISFKLGKHKKHLGWFDGYNESLYKLAALDNNTAKAVVCKSGDKDGDGVCDDWDRELNTPKGARVDGAGRAIDMDLDGIIDLDDKCVTIPGLATNNGCPYVEEETSEIVGMVNKFEGVEFELGKDIIMPKSFARLDKAAGIIKNLDEGIQFYIIGGTDARGSEELNIDLSHRRAEAVKEYLVQKGVKADNLFTEGKGKTDLKYPECNPATKCPEWKNEANRRVYFKLKQY